MTNLLFIALLLRLDGWGSRARPWIVAAAEGRRTIQGRKSEQRESAGEFNGRLFTFIAFIKSNRLKLMLFCKRAWRTRKQTWKAGSMAEWRR